MFERFTDQSRRAVVLAQEEARRLDHDYIGTEHLLAGLLLEKRGAGARALKSAGISLDAVLGEIERLAGRGTEPRRGSGHIPFTSPAKECLELSLREAVSLGHESIGTGHLLLGLTSKDDCVAVQILGELGAGLEQLRARAIEETEAHPEDLEPAPPPRPQRAQLPGAAQHLLDTIDDRLSAIERHLGIAPGAEPPDEPDRPQAEAARLQAEVDRSQAEAARLQAEVDRLRALLSEHDIDPGDSPAATG
jgi:ATP-dependent Clp protease ATP-binding subunit ClpA